MRLQEDAAPGVPGIAAENTAKKGLVLKGFAKGNA
jgi:hypothetical protein